MARVHRFFVDDESLSAEQARQVATVLRLSAGDVVTLVRDGHELDYRLETVTPSRVSGTVIARRPAATEPRTALTLALPILKGERSEEVVEAVAQLGVARIVPYISSRSVVRALSEAKLARWRKIAREAAETARRGRVPIIEAAVAFDLLHARLVPPVVVCWEEERGRPLRRIEGEHASLVIGPEGGLSAGEVDSLRSRGARVVTLGPRVLRAETAAIAAVALALAP